MTRLHALALLLLSAACAPVMAQTGGPGYSQQSHYELELEPLASEDIAGACHYSLDLSQTHGAVPFVWVIFDRGRDIHELASDADVLGFAHRFNVALLLQGHCPGKLDSDKGDMNMNPMQGLGPALMRALERFGQQTEHPELSRAKLIFLGFSGAGPLSARLVQAFSSRTIGVILSAPGHFDPQGIDTVNLDHGAQQVPELIVANGADDRSGTQRPYDYFVRYRREGAPWTFAVQNRSTHCCTANAKLLILGWLSAVISERVAAQPERAMRSADQQHAWLGSFVAVPTNIKDSSGLTTFNSQDVEVAPVGKGKISSQVSSWLPNAAVAREWKGFVEQEVHPVLPLR